MKALDPQGLADMVGLSKHQILKLIQARKIEHLRLGHRTIRFTEDQVKKFIREFQVRPS